MPNDLKVGDVVQLNSGGPEMTIEEIEGGRARCVWFDGMKKVIDFFVLAVLTKVE